MRRRTVRRIAPPVDVRLRFVLAAASLIAWCSGAHGQTKTAAPPAPTLVAPEIVVTGQRLPHAVTGPLTPELSLGRDAVAGLGANNVADILTELQAQAGGTQGRSGDVQLVLLNGRRISSIDEIKKLPPEAIARVDILPEEAALAYGYPAHQKVINIVLLPRYAAETGEIEGRIATISLRGDFNTEANLVRIDGDNRATLNAEYQIGDDLSQAARGIRRPGSDDGRLRSLIPLTHNFATDGDFARAFGNGLSFSLTGDFDRLISRSKLGPLGSNPARPLVRDSRADTGHIGATLAGPIGAWKWSATTTYDHVTSYVFTGGDTGLAPRTATARYDTVAGDLLVNGPLFRVPAGAVDASVRVSASDETVRGDDTVAGRTRLARTLVAARGSLDAPILAEASPVGSLTAGVNGEVRDYSTTSVFVDRGWSAEWQPLKPLSLVFSGSRESAVPTLAQLGAPQTATPGAALFDYGANQTVYVTELGGGDPTLQRDRRDLLKVEATVKPLTGLSMVVSFTDQRLRDPILAFGGIVPVFETAFPGRVTRDAGGGIGLVDTRPFNAAAEHRQDVRFGLNFNRTFKAPAGPKLPGGGLQGGNHYFGAQGSMVRFSLYDTVRVADRITLAPGTPPIDLAGDTPLGQALRVPRHTIDAELSATRHGFGLRASATWTSGGLAAADTPGTLAFGDRLTTSVRLFVFPAVQSNATRSMAWLKGVRLLFVVNDLFDSYQRVTDRSGATPLAFQRGYVEPFGRTVRFSIRKTFN